jgi:hypothetical protein
MRYLRFDASSGESAALEAFNRTRALSKCLSYDVYDPISALADGCRLLNAGLRRNCSLNLGSLRLSLHLALQASDRVC